MSIADMSALERIEFDACADFYRAAPEPVRAVHAVTVHEVAGAMCLTCRGIEPALVFRRAVGLGLTTPAQEADLDAVLEYMNARGRDYAVAIAPRAKPPELPTWLEQRGFSRAYAWMKFARSCEGPPRAECKLELRVIDVDAGDDFGRIVAAGFGLPASVVPWIAALAGRANWICVMAFADGEPAAAGAAYVANGYAWLGLGATLAAHRRLGAQSALVARRLEEAAARGARVAVTETGERLPDKPSQSYRNILRAGFEEVYLRQNYVSASTS